MTCINCPRCLISPYLKSFQGVMTEGEIHIKLLVDDKMVLKITSLNKHFIITYSVSKEYSKSFQYEYIRI